MSPEEFRKYGYAIVDLIADYRASVADRPVMAQSAPGEIKARTPAAPPEMAESFDAVLQDVHALVATGLTHWQHPRFFGYFPCNHSLSSVLGDYVSSGLGVLGLAWQASPALTEIEEVATGWLRQMLGLSDAWHGVIQDTASTSTLIALICARERATEYAMTRGGLQSVAQPLTVYTSAHGHSSVMKASLLAGFGRDNVRLVPYDAQYAMDADALRRLVDEDTRQGRRPCAIVATTGTTTTTAADPVQSLAHVAGTAGMWLHVDAAMAGSAMILPECRWMWEGIERADSIVVNPHKWLGTAFDCSVYYVRDPQHLVRVMSTNASYLRTSADGRVNNYRDWGIPLGRRFRALKLWCLIREQGVSGLQARLRRDIENARWLAAEVAAAPQWRVLAPVTLQTLCVRHEPPGLATEALDEHTLRWAERLNRSGQAYVTPAVLDDRWMVRVSVGAELTEREHIASLWSSMQAEAARRA
jgi:aromatic-L-amino-acid/L-tryptophan decarboxylase